MAVKYRRENPEVLYSSTATTGVEWTDVAYFKQLASNNPRKRVRLCAHGNADDRLHEMLIVHEKGAYVRPHKHPGKSESIHVIEGRADLLLFDDVGRIAAIVGLGDYASGATFYYRIAAPLFHTLLIRSEVLVFHEVTNGPFDRQNTLFAPWAPQDGDVAGVTDFLADLNGRLADMPAPVNSITGGHPT